MEQEITAAEEFRRHMEARKGEVTTVDVKAPSGFIYKFEQPSKVSMLFGAGQLPQFASSGAIDKWTKEGIVKAVEEGDADTLKLVKVAFDVCDRLLALSHSPKLVSGPADPTLNQVSVDTGEIGERVPNEDLDYLFQWIQAGGNESLMLGTFPVGSQQRPVARPNRKARRAKAK